METKVALLILVQKRVILCNTVAHLWVFNSFRAAMKDYKVRYIKLWLQPILIW